MKPDTIIKWHCKVWRYFWRRKCRQGKPGRPKINPEVIELIRRMVRHTKKPSQTWRTFLANHMSVTAACDFFVVPTLTFKPLYCFVVLSHDRRRIVHVRVTRYLNDEWTAQQIVEAFPGDGSEPRYVHRDRDSIYGRLFRNKIAAIGIVEVISAKQSPWQNPFAERVIGSIRRECTDHIIALGERHLVRVLRRYAIRKVAGARRYGYDASIDHRGGAMTRERPIPDCLDCPNDRHVAGFDRREFIRQTAGGVFVASAAAPLFAQDGQLTQDKQDKKGPKKPQALDSETHVTAFYKTLTAEQKKAFVFPFDHELRHKVDNNWRITPTRIGSLTGEQQALVFDIVKGLHSPEYADKVMRQIETDNGKNGFEKCSVAVFGEPGTGAFEFVFTGRHVTRRCDGDSVKGAAFGGPIFYGHAAGTFNEKPHHPGNVYWFQAKRANEVFQAMDGKQRAVALRSDPRRERGTKTVALSGKKKGLAGIPVGELSKDQKGLVRKVMVDLLAPFRKVDRQETMKLVEKGGFDNVHLSFYKNLDVGSDGVWDVWQLQGPAMLWYFRGHPHVHTWVHVRAPKKRKVI